MKNLLERLKLDTKNKRIAALAAAGVILIAAIAFFIYRIFFYVNLGESNVNNINIANSGFVTAAGDSIVLSVMPSTYNSLVENDLPEQGIIVMDSDGSNTRLLTQEYGTNLAFDGTYVYYCNVFDQNKLYRINIDGTEKTVLTDFTVSNVLVCDGWVYFHNGADFKIQRISCDLEKTQTIAENVSGTNMSISGGRLYFLNGESERSIYSVKLDGSGMRKLADIGYGYSFSIWEGDCYIMSNSQLLKINAVTGKQTVVKDNVIKYNICDGTLYYTDAEDNYLYRCSLDNTEEATQTNIYDCSQIGIANGQVFIKAYDVIYRLVDNGYATYGRYESLNKSN